MRNTGKAFFWAMIGAVVAASIAGTLIWKPQLTKDSEQTQELVNLMLLLNHAEAAQMEMDFWDNTDARSEIRSEWLSLSGQAYDLADNMDLRYGTDRPGLLTLDRDKAQACKEHEVRTRRLVRNRLNTTKPVTGIDQLKLARRIRKENTSEINRIAVELGLSR